MDNKIPEDYLQLSTDDLERLDDLFRAGISGRHNDCSFIETDRNGKITPEALIDELYGPPPGVMPKAYRDPYAHLTMHDVGRHLAQLGFRAFRTGDRVAANLLSNWFSDCPVEFCTYRAWALWSLLRARFYGTFERILYPALTSLEGFEAFAILISGDILSPESAAHYMSLALPEAELSECQDYCTGARPWVSTDQRIERIKTIIGSLIATSRESGGGSWD